MNFTNQWSSPTGNSPAKVAPPTTPQHTPNFIPPTNTTPTPGSTPQHQPKSPAAAAATAAGGEAKPDYSRSHFDSAFGKKNEPPKEKVKSTDVFGDLLGSQGYQFTAKKDNSPRTINEMRKEEMAKDMDPEKLKVMEWVRKFSFWFLWNNI